MNHWLLFTALPAKCARMAVSLFALSLACLLPMSALAQTGAGVSVRVTDATNGLPLDRVKLELLKFPGGILQMVFADAGGRAEFSNLAVQAYSIRATRDGYLPSETTFDIGRGSRYMAVTVTLQPERRERPSAPGGFVSAKSLAAPPEAREEFSKGLSLLNEKKDARGSLALLQHAIELAPQFYDAYVVLGLAHLQLQALDDAEKSFVRAMELEPRLLQPYHPLATILITRRRYEEAEKILHRALEIDPKGWQWPFELARSQAMQRNWEKAIVHGKRALAAANVPTKIHLLMADIYSNGGQVELAAAELDEFERLDPQSPYMPKVRAARAQLKKPTP